MSNVWIDSIKVENYRSFGQAQTFHFPNQSYGKPVAIVGYNNSGKTNLMNAILYGIGFNYVSKDTFLINDFHNRAIENIPYLELRARSSAERKYDGKIADLTGTHQLSISLDGPEIQGAKIETYLDNGRQSYNTFGAQRYYNIFYINFHKVKDEISTQRTSWGNLKSFLSKHLKKIVDSDESMHEKRDAFQEETKAATENVLRDSKLLEFVAQVKKNYSTNLRNNDCDVSFGLPDYEDIFLQMLFKIGLNGDSENLLPIDHFGDGYISMFVMAVIQAIAEENPDDKCLFLFEEPESFLHENHQEYFYKVVLRGLSEKGHQVIYTTHSDKMVDIFDTKGLIRIEFDEAHKQTIKKYNNLGEFSTREGVALEVVHEVVNLANYNSFIKSIEPNLNKILFSRKVLLVEGPNDIMAYKFAVEKKIVALGKLSQYAATYLNFLNISIITHHGKITALLLIDLCKHLGLDYFVINDLDFATDLVEQLSSFETEEALKLSELYRKDGDEDRPANSKGMLTTNWKLINSAGSDKIHFNIPKLERVLGYGSDDKNSLKIWNWINGLEEFSDSFFPTSLADFLELSAIERAANEALLEDTIAEYADILDLSEDEEDDLPF